MPFAISLILAAAFCNFTDRSRRDGLAGFPRHLFTLPVNTYYLVTCLMLCTLVSVAGIYVAWVEVCLRAVGNSIANPLAAHVDRGRVSCYSKQSFGA